MRNRTTILLLLLCLCGALWFAHNPTLLPQPQSGVPETLTPVQSVSTSSDPSSTAETNPSQIPFFVEPRPERFINSAKKQSLPKRVVMKKLPELLAEKEGSYTNLNDLFQHDETFSVDLRSEWATHYLFPDRNLPNLRVRIIKNPETGEYQPVGGVLTLPRSSLEAGYETDPGSGENKATLQWKKSF